GWPAILNGRLRMPRPPKRSGLPLEGGFASVAGDFICMPRRRACQLEWTLAHIAPSTRDGGWERREWKGSDLFVV
ncbi:MAG: hypothetical protein M1546_10130, partial [Chloroflexi bacterium]|nr:hypothetical protein [Chloroflexota bacterium]